MAVWQFSILLVPASWAEETKYDASLLYDEEGFDTALAWSGRQLLSSWRDVLSTILPPSSSWNDGLLMWGETKGHDIQVWYEDCQMDSICIRLALTDYPPKIVVKIVEAANLLNCVFFFPEHKEIVCASERGLTRAIKRSNAAQFITDPQGFLSALIT